MATSQFASLDGTAGYDTETLSYTPVPNTIARRSVSIFSRRGAETPPEPMPTFIAQAVIQPPKEDVDEKQKSWISRRKSSCSLSSSKPGPTPKLKGTVLNAVPPAKFIQMTALEEEMACSPNEEILSAVSEQSPAQYAWTAQPKQSAPTPQSNVWDKRGTSLLHRAKSGKKKDSHSRIGLWVNGVTQWDDEVRQYRAAVDEPSMRQDTRFAMVTHITVTTVI